MLIKWTFIGSRLNLVVVGCTTLNTQAAERLNAMDVSTRTGQLKLRWDDGSQMGGSQCILLLGQNLQAIAVINAKTQLVLKA